MTMRTFFAPGCALKAYKPGLIARMTAFLQAEGAIDGTWEPCCKSEQRPGPGTRLIVCCPGCAHKFASFPGVETVSLWKVLADTDFPFPDYGGRRMTIHDACRARHRDSSEMQASVRALCGRMGIELAEPEKTGTETPCCGGSAKTYEARVRMARERAAALPLEDVVLYCTGCVRSFSVTPARPHHILDLLYAETTEGLTIPRPGADPGSESLPAEDL